jgi:hypothetical protein
VLKSELPASGPFIVARVSDASLPAAEYQTALSEARVRDLQGAQQSGLSDRAKAEPEAARPAGKCPEVIVLRFSLYDRALLM